MLEILKKFCGDDPGRPYLMEPFTQGKYTYATNGHIMVRVPPVDGVGPLEFDRPLKVEVPFAPIDAGTVALTPLTVVLPPAPETSGECANCLGRGYVKNKSADCPECDECTCECRICDGAGDLNVELRTSTMLRGVHFNLAYIRRMLSLPGPIAVYVPQGGALRDAGPPLLFSFAGGVGAVMPMRGPFPRHIEIETAQ